MGLLENIDQDFEALPNSAEAEQALLGALLYENELYHRISGTVRVDDFYNPVHAKIYETISGLISAGKLADVITLKDRGLADDTLDDIGGVPYLAQLLTMAPAAAGITAPEYAKLIKERSLRRQLLGFSEELTETVKALDSEETPEQMIESAEAALFSLGETGSTARKVVTFNTALVDYLNSAAAAYNRDGKLSGISTGLDSMDELLGGLHKSDLIILAGRPSMGKTALATNIAFSVAKAFKEKKQDNGVMKTVNGGRVMFFSLEMSHEQLAGRMLAEESGVPAFAVRKGAITAMQYEQIRDAADTVSNIPLYIDDRGGQTIAQLATRARRQKRMTGVDLIIVDYLQLLSAKGKSSDGRVQEVTQITMGLKALAKDLDVPVLALAQLSRAVEQRENKRPQLSDLRESGSIEQDADVVAFCYREEYYLERDKPEEGTEEFLEWVQTMDKARGKASVIVGKQRHGPIGDIRLGFISELTKFHDLEAVE